MKNAVFYHVWGSPSLGVTILIIDSQLNKIYSSGLHKDSKIVCVVSGHHCGEVSAYLKTFSWIEMVITKTEHGENKYEAFTLEFLHKFCVSNPQANVLYFHTKGCATLSDANPDGTTHITFKRNTNSWRNLMDWVCITNWKDRVKELETYDTTGCRFGNGPSPHYSGNFWWAKGSYVKKLVPLKDYTHDWGERMKCEFWIGSGNPNYHNIPTKHIDLPYDSWGWH